MVALRHEDPLAPAEANPDHSKQKWKKSSAVGARQSIQSERIPPWVLKFDSRHCEEQRGEAIHFSRKPLDCFADARNDDAIALGLATFSLVATGHGRSKNGVASLCL
jgi:hypothetical protein